MERRRPDHQPVSPKFQIGDIEADELRTAKRAGNRQQHEGTIPHVDRLVKIELGDHGTQVFCNDQPLAGLHGPLGPTDSGHHLAHSDVLGWENRNRPVVRLRDHRRAASEC